jgi:hypothetical protein
MTKREAALHSRQIQARLAESKIPKNFSTSHIAVFSCKG